MQRGIAVGLLATAALVGTAARAETPLHKKVTVEYRNKELATVLKDLGEKAGVRFEYAEKLMKGHELVFCLAKDQEAGAGWPPPPDVTGPFSPPPPCRRPAQIRWTCPEEQSCPTPRSGGDAGVSGPPGAGLAPGSPAMAADFSPDASLCQRGRQVGGWASALPASC